VIVHRRWGFARDLRIIRTTVSRAGAKWHRRVHDRWKMHCARISVDGYINYLCVSVSALSERDTRLPLNRSILFFSIHCRFFFCRYHRCELARGSCELSYGFSEGSTPRKVQCYVKLQDVFFFLKISVCLNYLIV